MCSRMIWTIRRDGVQVRVAPDVNERLESISDETGLAKTKVLDVILRMRETISC